MESEKNEKKNNNMIRCNSNSYINVFTFYDFYAFHRLHSPSASNNTGDKSTFGFPIGAFYCIFVAVVAATFSSFLVYISSLYVHLHYICLVLKIEQR